MPSALLTSFQQGVVIYQIIFNGKESEALLQICYNSTKRMENYISCLLKNINKTQIKSIQQMEKDLLTNNYRQSNSLQNLNKTQNVTDIKVVSPFYARPDCNNQNCFCPYHRKMRIKQIPLKKIENKTFYIKTAKSSPNTKVTTEIKENLLRVNQRLTAKKSQPSKIHNLLNWQARKNIISRNFEFEEFIKQFEQILLKKAKLNVLDLHRIKSSVGEIFKYIYSHLHQERQVVQDHISKIEKDKDFTYFYMQRFIELKELKAKRKEEKELNKLKTAKQKTIMGTLQNLQENQIRKKSKARTKLYERKDLVKRMIKTRYQKLMAQQFLEDIDCGQEIEDYQIQKFADLDIEKFQENCEFLQKMINKKDGSMLDELLNQILQKAQKKIGQIESHDCIAVKSARLERLVNLINAKIEELHQTQDYQKPSFKLRTSQNSMKTGGNSINSIGLNKKLTILGKINQSPFTKFGFNQIKKDNSDSELSKDDVLDEMEEKFDDDILSVQRQSPEATTIFAEGEKENTKVRARKSGKLQLAKYRRLSHDPFYRKKIFGEQQQFILQKIKIIKLDDISQELENLAYQFAEKKYKVRDIQRKIKDFSLQKYMINENDSLITAKRKIRVIKTLLKDEELDDHLKREMKEYLTLIDEQNYLKNRRWAKKKIRNMLQMGVEKEQVELLQVEGGQSEKNYFQRLIGDICGKNSKLIFYQIFKAVYQQKQTNFQQQVINNKDHTIILQKKQGQVKPGVKNIQEKKNRNIFEQEGKESALMQMGLNNKCISNPNYYIYRVREGEQQFEIGMVLHQEQIFSSMKKGIQVGSISCQCFVSDI